MPGRMYRVTYVDREGEQVRHYFNTAGLANPARLEMDKIQAATYTLETCPDAARIVRVVRLWSLEANDA